MDILNSNYEYRANIINHTQVPSETNGAQVKSEPTGQAAMPTSTADRVTVPDSRMEAAPSTADQTILKALAASGLPMSERNRSLVRELLNQKLPVDKQTLQMFARLSAVNRSASALTLVLMYKNQIPITPANLRQFEAYQNGNHRLLQDIQSLAKNITELLKSLQMTQEPGTPAGMEHSSNGMPEAAVTSKEMPMSGGAIPQETAVQSNNVPAAVTTASSGYGDEGLTGYQIPLEASPGGQSDLINLSNKGEAGSALPSGAKLIPTGLEAPEGASGNASVSPAGIAADILASEATVTDSSFGHPSSDASLSPQFLNSETVSSNVGTPPSTSNGSLNLKDVIPWLSEALEVFPEAETSTEGTLFAKPADGESPILKNMIQYHSDGTLKELSPELLNHLDKLLRQKWTLTPEQLSDKDSLKDLYKKLEEDLNRLDSLIRFHRETQETQLSKEPIRNLQDNLQFMKALNQLFSYVQLPLRFQDREVHGELYVFNKKNALPGRKDTLSVLIHLDMTELGALNIHMKLERDQIQATFAVDNTEAGNIIQDHLPELTAALTRKGYQLKARVEKQEQPKELIKDFLEQDPSGNSIQTFSFDTRA